MGQLINFLRQYFCGMNGLADIRPKLNTADLRRVITLLIAVSCLATAAPSTVCADDDGWFSAGVRGGVGKSRKSEPFSKYEAYLAYGFSPFWESKTKWALGPSIGASAGKLVCEMDAFTGSAGGGLYLVSPSKQLSITLTLYVTYIDRWLFPNVHLGGPLQFTSNLGFHYSFSKSVIIGYNYEHISNAGFYDHNPGINNHLIELQYRF